MKYVLVDASWLAYRAKYALGQLATGDMQTGLTFGFLEEVRATAANYRVSSNAVILCFDDRYSYRRAVFPGYKGRRNDRTPEEQAEWSAAKDQLENLRRVLLPAAGFVCLRQKGLESDDVIAQAAKQLNGLGHADKGVIVTSDGDLYQAIGPNVDWFNPARDEYLDEAGAHRKLGIPVTSWGAVKAIAGCSGDDVPGVPGVGVKTATDYLLGLVKKGARFEAIESADGRAVAKFNEELVILPHPKTEAVELKAPVYIPGAFYREAKALGFASFLNGPRRRAWDAFFAGDFTNTRQKPRKRHVEEERRFGNGDLFERNAVEK